MNRSRIAPEYFKTEESIAYAYGRNTKKILDVMAKRFAGENPPMDYQMRTWRENGIPNVLERPSFI